MWLHICMAGPMTAYRCDVTSVLAAQMVCRPTNFCLCTYNPPLYFVYVFVSIIYLSSLYLSLYLLSIFLLSICLCFYSLSFFSLYFFVSIVYLSSLYMSLYLSSILYVIYLSPLYHLSFFSLYVFVSIIFLSSISPLCKYQCTYLPSLFSDMSCVFLLHPMFSLVSLRGLVALVSRLCAPLLLLRFLVCYFSLFWFSKFENLLWTGIFLLYVSTILYTHRIKRWQNRKVWFHIRLHLKGALPRWRMS